MKTITRMPAFNTEGKILTFVKTHCGNYVPTYFIPAVVGPVKVSLNHLTAITPALAFEKWRIDNPSAPLTPLGEDSHTFMWDAFTFTDLTPFQHGDPYYVEYTPPTAPVTSSRSRAAILDEVAEVVNAIDDQKAKLKRLYEELCNLA